MNSLRARLVVGFSLVAVVPLALAMILLGTRIQHTVRAEADARLALALGVVRDQLQGDSERLTARLAVLANDPELKRLYLVVPDDRLELRQYLADQSFLLGLDYLAVVDSAGRVQADAAMATAARSRSGVRLAADALPAAADSSAGVVMLRGSRAVALDASAPIHYQDERVGCVRGGSVLDVMFLARLRRASGLDLMLQDSTGRMLASTFNPRDPAHPVALQGTMIVLSKIGRADVSERISVYGRTYLMRSTPLHTGAGTTVHLTALASTATADDALAVLRTTALALGLLGLVLAVLLGGLWSHQLSRPVEQLAEFSERISRGEWDEPLELQSMRELQKLVAALERMRSDLRAYRDKLRSSERQAAYGQMARKVAHEIKNPLTPIAISVAGLKRSYDQKHPDFAATLEEAVRTVGEEVQRLKTLLQEFSDLGRFPSPRLARFDLASLLGDLRSLYAHEVAARRLAFEWPADPLLLMADRDQLRQALINLVQNALDATAGSAGHVRLVAATQGGFVWLVVSDDGPGLSATEREQLFVPGFTTKAHGSGLGLTIVERIVSDHGGTIEVESEPGQGTSFVVRLALERES